MGSVNVSRIEKKEDVVYDISLDGTVVNALGLNVLSNTDGVNFQLPEKFRYTEENPYISNGEGRNSIKGKAYIGLEADVCEFEDLYLNKAYDGGVNKMGLGVDALYDATINIKRKVYANLLPDGTVKLVGNSIKSRKMPLYISKFFGKAIPMLLNNKGKDFMDYYYDYIERIYNIQIPPMEIASRGIIKMPIEKYIKECKKDPDKPRKAYYELVIRDKVKANVGDTIYYINTSNGKNAPDVQKEISYYFIDEEGNKEFCYKDDSGQYVNGNNGTPITINDALEEIYSHHKEEFPNSKAYKNMADFVRRNYPQYKERHKIILSCTRITDNRPIAYNAEKYISILNSKIFLLMNCFDRSLRSGRDGEDNASKLLIPNPRERKFFADDDLKLVSGQPIDKTEQDDEASFMRLEEKEVNFWKTIDKTPPFD